MKWSEVRQHFPERCVLVEALISEIRGKERVIEEMAVIDDFDNAMKHGKHTKNYILMNSFSNSAMLEKCMDLTGLSVVIFFLQIN